MNKKLFSEIRKSCKTDRQKNAFNQLIKSFNVKRVTLAENIDPAIEPLIDQNIDDRTKIVDYIGKFNSLRDALKNVPETLKNNTTINKDLINDDELRKGSVFYVFVVEVITDFEEGEWNYDYKILTGKQLNSLKSNEKEEKKAEKLLANFIKDVDKLSPSTKELLLWRLLTRIIDYNEFAEIDSEVKKLFNDFAYVTSRYGRGYRSDNLEW